MGLDLDNALVQIKLTQSVCGFVAICMTVSRLYIRRGRYWWDDAWAFFSLLNLFVQFAGVFLHLPHPTLPKTSRVASYYLIATTFYTIIWSARLSILFSIIRIDPNPRMHTRLKYVAATFVFCIIFFIAQLMWVCEPGKGGKGGWKNVNTGSPQCELGKQVAICQIVTDVISDMLLIILPLRLIQDLRDKGLRRRLMVIFSTSIVTTIVSLVHAAYIIRVGGTKVVIIAAIEDTMSLTVANFPVMATAFFKVFGVYRASSGDVASVDGGWEVDKKAGGEGIRFGANRGTRGTSFGFRTVSRVSRASAGTVTSTEGAGSGTEVGFKSVGESEDAGDEDAGKSVDLLSRVKEGRTVEFAVGDLPMRTLVLSRGRGEDEGESLRSPVSLASVKVGELGVEGKD